jgi:aldose 1-epimerase
MPQHAWPDTEPTEVRLAAGDARLTVDLRGGGMSSLTAGTWDVLDPYPAGTVVAGWPGSVLLPWPNRIRFGRWAWRGRDLQLDVGSPEAPHALHGLVSWQRWTPLVDDGGSATVATTLEPHQGYPFRLAGAVDYALGPEQLAVTVRVRNLGTEPAPFGAGMHPYLSVGAATDGGIEDAELALPVRAVLELDGGLPTGNRAPMDGAVGRIGDRVFDDAFTDLVRDEDGWARTTLRGSAGELELAVDRAWSWLQVFSSDTLP